MTHDELLASIDYLDKVKDRWNGEELAAALRAVVKLHSPWIGGCSQCVAIDGGYKPYPCPTIQTIEKELA
jgi:alkylhydroperoxidase family enzyme